MINLQVLYLTTTAAFTGCICGSFCNKLKHSFLKVKASPSCPGTPVDCQTPEHEHNVTKLLQSPLDGRKVQRGTPKGAPGVQGWIHAPGSCKWIAAISKPGGLASQWLPYEKGGHIFPHFEVPRRVVLDYEDFLLCYDTETKTPIWVLEEVTTKGLTAKCTDFKNMCRLEERIPENLAPFRGDYFTEREKFKFLTINYLDFHNHVLNESYVMTGLAPKVVRNVKEHKSYELWDELYHYVYQLKLSYNYDEVFVLSGPLYLPKKDETNGNMYRNYGLMGKSKIGVPTHFFKVIVAIKAGRIRFECFKFENKLSDLNHPNYDLRTFTVPREQLEKEAGFSIFKEIEDSQIAFKCMEPNYIKTAYRSMKRF